MAWPTTTGNRILNAAESDLVLGAVGMMVDTHVAELRDDADPWVYGIDWFDQWEPEQRLWLLQQVTLALVRPDVSLEPAAMFDAAVDAIFHEIIDLVQIEIEQGSATSSKRSWRASVLAAVGISAGAEPDDVDGWAKLVVQLADSILGVRLYQRAEMFRDGAYEQSQKFLCDRGLPTSYLDRIPPLRSIDETQWSIDQIQAIVFRM